MFDKFISSSIDANKVSLTVKGFLLMLLPLTVSLTGIDSASGSSLIDAVTQVVFISSSLASAMMVVYGLARKLYLGHWSAGE